MPLKKSELYSSLWSSCDKLRGGMDSSQYKDYVLVLLFMKYVSDKYAGRKNALLEVPGGGSFADMAALNGDKEVGGKINKIIGRLAEANDLKGVIDVAEQQQVSGRDRHLRKQIGPCWETVAWEPSAGFHAESHRGRQAMKGYFRVMLGKKSVHAAECFAGGFMGVDFGIAQDLTGKLPEDIRPFNREFIPVYLAAHPDVTSKIAAGLSCGFLWTVSKWIKVGDVVLSPDGSGRYRFGEVVGDYSYKPDGILPHRRPVRWSDRYIDRSDMSETLQKSTGSIGTVSDVSRHRDEIEKFLGGTCVPPANPEGEVIEDQAAFAMEKHLEDFLVQNWGQTELGKEYDIFEEEGERVGQQYPTDTGPIDILAVSKDKQRLLVVELKKGRASDSVVGQALRYMGFVQEVLAEKGQTVQGAIIALEDDQRIRRALAMAPSIAFYRYEISFKLRKG